MTNVRDIEADEIPWPDSPVDAWVAWEKDVDPPLGHLHFLDPRGQRACVLVTRDKPFSHDFKHVWHIAIQDHTRTASVSPSIHFVGRWHTPSPVRFTIMPKEEWDGLHG